MNSRFDQLDIDIILFFCFGNELYALLAVNFSRFLDASHSLFDCAPACSIYQYSTHDLSYLRYV